MTLQEVVKWLLDNEYGVMMGTQFVQTEKLNNELAGRTTVTVQPTATTPVTSTDKKSVWNDFILKASVPHRVTSSIGTYTIRQYNLPAVNKLISILNDSSVQSDVFVKSTENYYKSVSGRTTLSKYLLSDLWRDEYNEWLKNPNKQQNDGSSIWES